MKIIMIENRIGKYLFYTVLLFLFAGTFNSYAQNPEKDSSQTKKEISIESDDLSMLGVIISPKRADTFLDINFDPDLYRGDINVTITNKDDVVVFKKMYKKGTIKNHRIRIDVKDYKKGLYKVEIVTLEVSLEMFFIKQ